MANFYGSYVGFGGGGEVAVPKFYGAEYQFCHGGQQAGPTGYNTIDRLSYTSEATADDWHDLAVTMFYTTGQSSGTHGFCAGGHAQTTTINKYQQLAQVLGVDHGDLGTAGSSGMSASAMLEQYGYVQGGIGGTQLLKQKWAFASNTTSSDAGNLSAARNHGGGASSPTHGYCHGGYNSSGSGDFFTIDRFPFASDGTSVDIGDLTVSRGTMQGSSSATHGFKAGGYGIGEGYTNVIDKYLFAAGPGNDAVDWGNLTATIQGNTGSSATSYGYACGGQPPATVSTSARWSHDSDAGASIWGALSQARVYPECSQY